MGGVGLSKTMIASIAMSCVLSWSLTAAPDSLQRIIASLNLCIPNRYHHTMQLSTCRILTWTRFLRLYRLPVKISIELFGQLSPLSPRRQTLDLAPQSKVQEAAAILGLNSEDIGIITING